MFKVGKNWITSKNNDDFLNHKVSYKADLTVNLYCVNYMYMYVICSGMCICSLKVKVLFAQLCPTFFDPMDCSPPGSSVHGILQAKIREWVANLFSKGSFQPRDQILVSCITGGFLYHLSHQGRPLQEQRTGTIYIRMVKDTYLTTSLQWGKHCIIVQYYGWFLFSYLFFSAFSTLKMILGCSCN